MFGAFQYSSHEIVDARDNDTGITLCYKILNEKKKEIIISVRRPCASFVSINFFVFNEMRAGKQKSTMTLFYFYENIWRPTRFNTNYSDDE